MGTGQSEEEGPVTKVNLGRLTNCIYAFTLLYLFKNIHIPTVFDTDSPGFLPQYLAIILPETFNFLNAFLLVAIIWILTFHNLHLVRKVSNSFLYLHFGMLMPFVFIPVTSMLADDFPDENVFSLFMHLNVLAIGCYLLFEWLHICRNQDIKAEDITSSDIAGTFRGILFLITVAGTGVLLSLYGRDQTRFLYLIVPGVLFIDSVIHDLFQRRKNPIMEERKLTPEQAGILFPGETPAIQSAGPDTGVRFRGPVGMDMLEILMNGVFGFTMTLIVKNIPLPTVATVENQELLGRFFIRIIFDSIEFVIVFIILAIIWLLAFQVLRWVKTVDLTFVYLEFLELLFIVFIPVTSTLLTLFGDQAHISAAYSLNITLCGMILVIQWFYLAARPHLLVPDAAIPVSDGTIPAGKGVRLNFLGKREKGSFYQLQKRLFILPAASILWLILTLTSNDFAIMPAVLGFFLLVYIS